MTDTEIRIAIAGACGWRCEYDTTQLKSVWIGPKSGYAYALEDMVPDYPNDLNAMHDAEKVLTNDQKIRYIDVLDDTVPLLPDTSEFALYHATARQRAEAFLKTLNKWKDLKPKHNEKDHNPNLSTL